MPKTQGNGSLAKKKKQMYTLLNVLFILLGNVLYTRFFPVTVKAPSLLHVEGGDMGVGQGGRQDRIAYWSFK